MGSETVEHRAEVATHLLDLEEFARTTHRKYFDAPTGDDEIIMSVADIELLRARWAPPPRLATASA